MTGTAQVAPPPVPRTFLEYVRSFGPGIVIVLTWLGAGDVVDMATAGANYGYSLLWVFVAAVLIRFLFVSLISRYQLCNQHREGVLDGLVRLHPAYAPILFVAAVVMGHVYGSYMTRGMPVRGPAQCTSCVTSMIFRAIRWVVATALGAPP